MKEIVEILEYRAGSQNFEEFLCKLLERLKVFRYTEHLIVKIRRILDCPTIELEVQTNLILPHADSTPDNGRKRKIDPGNGN